MSTELQSLGRGAKDSLATPEVAVLRLEMTTHKVIRYQIIHPPLPVFDASELALSQIVAGRPLLFVVDRKVMALFGDNLKAYAATHLHIVKTIVIDGDESNKTWRQAEAICEAAMECQLARHGVIVGVGGGVTLDVTGFAASIYRRGISYLRIPTTLIGQVDVSVGVKHGINAGGFKNILGSFHPPLASINDVSFLRSLPSAHIAAGLAEIVKIAMIRDCVLFDLIEAHAEALLLSRFQQPKEPARLIMERAEVGMLTELQGNLFETDLKRPVDFGHTFSPAFETASNYTLPHGYAVALDMLISTRVAVGRNMCPESVFARLIRLYARIGLSVSQHFCTAAALHESLASVRAHRGGALNLVVPTGLGSVAFLQEVSLAELEQALGFLNDSMHSNAGPGI